MVCTSTNILYILYVCFCMYVTTDNRQLYQYTYLCMYVCTHIHAYLATLQWYARFSLNRRAPYVYTRWLYNIMFDWDFTMMSHEEIFLNHHEIVFYFPSTHINTLTHLDVHKKLVYQVKELINLTKRKIKIFVFHLFFWDGKEDNLTIYTYFTYRVLKALFVVDIIVVNCFCLS